MPLDKLFIDRIRITMFKVEYELLYKPVIQMFVLKRYIHSHDIRYNNVFQNFN